MPIDFKRVPPQVEMPPAPQVSRIVWTALLALVMGIGAGLALLLWPADRPANTLWFWFCVVGYPFLAWVFLLFSWLGYGYGCRNQAIANNLVRDKTEQACHAMASSPLAILGHDWCFAANDAENSLDGILTGSESIKLRPSGAVPDREVNARWLDIPDVPFYPGNELSEYARHQFICAWLLERFIARLLPQLRAFPPQTKLQVELYHRSWMESEAIETCLRELLDKQVPGLEINLEVSDRAPSLFRVDTWLDNQDVNTAHLLIAIELRNAISAVLSDGVAEAGVALLVGPVHLASSIGLRLHRPAKGTFDAVARILELAVRWGQSSYDRLRMMWTHGLSSDKLNTARQAASWSDDARWATLETSVGDCSGAGSWLAVVLAAESARTTGDPQLVVCGEGKELIALICRKQK